MNNLSNATLFSDYNNTTLDFFPDHDQYNSNHNHGDNTNNEGIDMTLGSYLWCLLSIVLLMWCWCSPSNVPSEEVIQRARRNLLLRQEMREKEESAKRRSLVQANLRTKQVVGQDANGNWTLGNVTTSTISTTAATSQKNQEKQEASLVVSPPSTIPSSVSSSAEPSPEDQSSCGENANGFEDEDSVNHHFDNNNDSDGNEDHVCVICLEAFQVGDIVSWSKKSKTCPHVFHTDCITPWLEKLHHECPSCRSPIIPKPTSKTTSDILEGLELEEGEETAVKQEVEQDDDVDNDEDDNEESLFVIVQGLVSRVAKQTILYSLVGGNDDLTYKDKNEAGTETLETEAPAFSSCSSCAATESTSASFDLSTPSPMRRVVSYDPVRTSSSSSSSACQTSNKTSSSPSSSSFWRSSPSPIFRMVENSGQYLSSPFPLQRSLSDQSHQFQKNKKMIVSPISSCAITETHSGDISDDDDDDDSYDNYNVDDDRQVDLEALKLPTSMTRQGSPSFHLTTLRHDHHPVSTTATLPNKKSHHLEGKDVDREPSSRVLILDEKSGLSWLNVHNPRKEEDEEEESLNDVEMGVKEKCADPPSCEV